MLCHTGVVYVRAAAGRTLSFIVSGKLWRNGMVMQDRETETLWSQVTGEALVGELAGEWLETLPAVQTTWCDWVALYPETAVLRQSEAVTASHYEAYLDDPDRIGLFPLDWSESGLPGKELVHGILRGDAALAVADQRVLRGGLHSLEVGGEAIVMLRSDDGGVRAYVARAGERALRFTIQSADSAGTRVIADEETDSIWDLSRGSAVDGLLAGSQLEELQVHTAFWFAWSAFHPRTRLIE